MADPDPPPESTELSPEARCLACRGSGRVVSRLGGEPSEVECPWCEGSGRFDRDHDAQARRRDERPVQG